MTANHTSITHLLSSDYQKSPIQTPSSYAPSKESEPRPVKSQDHFFDVQEIREPEPQIKGKELSHYLKVEQRHEPQLDPRLKKAGLSSIDFVSLDPKQRMKLPLSDEKIMAGLEAPVNSSFRWFSVFLVYLLHKAHIMLKKVHGHVVRILIR